MPPTVFWVEAVLLSFKLSGCVKISEQLAYQGSLALSRLGWEWRSRAREEGTVTRLEKRVRIFGNSQGTRSGVRQSRGFSPGSAVHP